MKHPLESFDWQSLDS